MKLADNSSSQRPPPLISRHLCIALGIWLDTEEEQEKLKRMHKQRNNPSDARSSPIHTLLSNTNRERSSSSCCPHPGTLDDARRYISLCGNAFVEVSYGRRCRFRRCHPCLYPELCFYPYLYPLALSEFYLGLVIVPKLAAVGRPCLPTQEGRRRPLPETRRSVSWKFLLTCLKF